MSDDGSREFLRGFGQLINAMGANPGGDIGQMFPQSDVDDIQHGARFIPGDVTLARRAGKKVIFHTSCTPCCWYWEFEDGSKIYHFERHVMEQINAQTERNEATASHPCPNCGNLYTRGGRVSPQGEYAQL